jgi:rare lipoprotein A (peptidoglycan hydrolase)
MVAAIAFGHFTTPNPNLDPMCGKRVKIMDLTTSKSIVVTVRDKCEACKMNDIDVSPSAFEKLKPKTVGRFKVVWDFI